MNSSAVYFCDEGYKERETPGDSNRIHCLADGTWSTLNFECVPIGKRVKEVE